MCPHSMLTFGCALASMALDGFKVIPTPDYWRGDGMAATAKQNSLIFKVAHPAGSEALAKLA